MLFFNTSRKNQYTDFSEVALDMHSHLIPGVDHGATDINDSLALMTGLKNLGFNHLITTPHTQQELYPNTREQLVEAHNSLKNVVPNGLTLRLSSEYYLDREFRSKLETRNVIPLPGNRLLIAFDKLTKPYDLEDRIFDLIARGFQPILAHPERYLFFHSHFGSYKRIKKMGVELQLSALSLTDYYGKAIRKIAEKLVEKDMIDFIGTDIHQIAQLEVLATVPKSKFFSKLLDSGMLKNRELI